MASPPPPPSPSTKTWQGRRVTFSTDTKPAPVKPSKPKPKASNNSTERIPKAILPNHFAVESTKPASMVKQSRASEERKGSASRAQVDYKDDWFMVPTPKRCGNPYTDWDVQDAQPEKQIRDGSEEWFEVDWQTLPHSIDLLMVGDLATNPSCIQFGSIRPTHLIVQFEDARRDYMDTVEAAGSFLERLLAARKMSMQDPKDRSLFQHARQMENTIKIVMKDLGTRVKELVESAKKAKRSLKPYEMAMGKEMLGKLSELEEQVRVEGYNRKLYAASQLPQV